jgi:hypothetical protein
MVECRGINKTKGDEYSIIKIVLNKYKECLIKCFEKMVSCLTVA